MIRSQRRRSMFYAHVRYFTYKTLLEFDLFGFAPEAVTASGGSTRYQDLRNDQD
jgi:hypothetical protein